MNKVSSSVYKHIRQLLQNEENANGNFLRFVSLPHSESKFVLRVADVKDVRRKCDTRVTYNTEDLKRGK